MTDIDKIEALAKEAEWTGRWYYAGCNTVECKYPPSTHNYAGQVDEIAHPVPLNVAPFIAEANPETVLALIAEVRALRDDKARLDFYEANLESDRSREGVYSVWLDHGWGDEFTGNTFREAIDAARSKQ